jgi:hypothetical protein
MKKTTLVFTLLLTLLSQISWAQSERYGRFGVQVSPTISWMTTNDKQIEGAGSNWGLKLGVLGEYVFNDNTGLFAGLGFGFNQGGTIQNGYTSGVFWPDSDLSSPLLDTVPMNAKLHYRLNYVEIPFGLRMRTGSRGDQMRFYAEIPVFTLGFKTKAVGDIRGTNGRDSEDEDISDDVNALAISWGLGAGLEYKLPGVVLVGGLGYQSQFTDATSDKGAILKSSAWEKEDSKATIGTIILRLGVFFGD